PSASRSPLQVILTYWCCLVSVMGLRADPCYRCVATPICYSWTSSLENHCQQSCGKAVTSDAARLGRCYRRRFMLPISRGLAELAGSPEPCPASHLEQRLEGDGISVRLSSMSDVGRP